MWSTCGCKSGACWILLNFSISFSDSSHPCSPQGCCNSPPAQDPFAWLLWTRVWFELDTSAEKGMPTKVVEWLTAPQAHLQEGAHYRDHAAELGHKKTGTLHVFQCGLRQREDTYVHTTTARPQVKHLATKIKQWLSLMDSSVLTVCTS